MEPEDTMTTLGIFAVGMGMNIAIGGWCINKFSVIAIGNTIFLLGLMALTGTLGG